MKSQSTPPHLQNTYRVLKTHYGPQRWWPADSPFEVIVGAILTQNTAWRNVEKAIHALRVKGLLTPRALHRIPRKNLGRIIRPAGTFNLKADRIKSFARFLFTEYGGSLEAMFAEETSRLRELLLQIKGIGPETADSILLYAAHRPIFVVDAYTRRVLFRHRFIEPRMGYQDLQEWIMNRVRKNAKCYNEFHALIVALGKEYCRAKPLCQGCPLEPLLQGRPPRMEHTGGKSLVS